MRKIVAVLFLVCAAIFSSGRVSHASMTAVGLVLGGPVSVVSCEVKNLEDAVYDSRYNEGFVDHLGTLRQLIVGTVLITPVALTLGTVNGVMRGLTTDRQALQGIYPRSNDVAHVLDFCHS